MFCTRTAGDRHLITLYQCENQDWDGNHLVQVTCKIDSQWELAVWLRELKQGFCDNLEGRGGQGDGREVWEGGDMGVPMADFCWYVTENHKIL